MSQIIVAATLAGERPTVYLRAALKQARRDADKRLRADPDGVWQSFLRDERFGRWLSWRLKGKRPAVASVLRFEPEYLDLVRMLALRKAGLSYGKIADEFDGITPEQIRKRVVRWRQRT